MTVTSVGPRHGLARSASLRDSLREWMDGDHPVSDLVLVPLSLAGVAGLFLVGYALLFLS